MDRKKVRSSPVHVLRQLHSLAGVVTAATIVLLSVDRAYASSAHGDARASPEPTPWAIASTDDLFKAAFVGHMVRVEDASARFCGMVQSLVTPDAVMASAADGQPWFGVIEPHNGLVNASQDFAKFLARTCKAKAYSLPPDQRAACDAVYAPYAPVVATSFGFVEQITVPVLQAHLKSGCARVLNGGYKALEASLCSKLPDTACGFGRHVNGSLGFWVFWFPPSAKCASPHPQDGSSVTISGANGLTCRPTVGVDAPFTFFDDYAVWLKAWGPYSQTPTTNQPVYYP